jgi:hypothetical protein
METENSPFAEKDAIGRYLPLMHELAMRIELVARACDGHLGVPLPFAREYIYLQFRHICELIALGCLQLHGDLPSAQTQSVKKAWNAEKIMRLLHKNHPHCFPQCVERTKTEEGWSIKANGKPNAMTFEEFKALYSECGEALHRGTIRSIQAAGPLAQADFQALVTWQSKIVDLMNEHLVGRASGSSFYLISLRTGSGYPECSVFTKSGEGGMHVSSHKMEILGSQFENLMLIGNMKPTARSDA